MFRILLPLLAIATVSLGTLSIGHAHDGADEFELLYSSKHETQLQEYKARCASLEYRRELSRYISGVCSIRNVIDASQHQLRAALKSGLGKHAIEYDARMADLQKRVQSQLNLGVSTQEELDEVLASRLDAIVSKSVLAPAK